MAAPDPPQPAPQLPYLTFPPFPEIPPGSLCAFKDFQPSGIQVPVDESNEIELDGLGIPTLELRVKHNTDESKTGKKRKKKSKKAVDGEPIKRLTWWEEWEEGEDLRLVHAGFGSGVPRVDRLIKAAQDFADGRRWPPMMTGVRAFWDSYRLYLGLLINPNLPKTTNTGGQDEPPDADISDDEDEPMQPMKQVVKGDANTTQDDDGDGIAEIEELAEDRLVVFLNSPEKSTKVFLTQYMREHGLIWSEKNLIIAPRLLTFFFNFLLRNHILHESSSERGLRAALEVTELALEELPLTAKMGQALPDRLSMGLKEVFGRMASAGFMPDAEAIIGGWGGCADEQDAEEEGPRKRVKVEEAEEIKDKEANDTKGQAKVDSNEFEAELKAANATIIRTDDLAPDAIKQIVEDNVGMDVDVNPGDTIIDSGWGDEAGEPSSGWGPTEADNNEVNPAWGDWGQTEESAAEWSDAWAPLQHSNLMDVLGPTTLPLTHTTGIVEKSTRRIKSIILPSIVPSALTAQAAEGEDPVAVEEEMEQRFARVVLQPWVGDKSPDAGTPIIRLSSEGAVYPGTQLEDGSIVEGDLPPPEIKVHNPLTSEITLLVELNMVDILSVGMGLEATWIQLVKQEGKDGGAGGKKKKKSKGSKIPKGYWYMEELLMTFPSFYTHELEKLAE